MCVCVFEWVCDFYVFSFFYISLFHLLFCSFLTTCVVFFIYLDVMFFSLSLSRALPVAISFYFAAASWPSLSIRIRTQLTPCCNWKIVHQFSDLMATFCSCEMRMCSLRLYLFLKFLLQRSHLRGGWGVCWVRICLQRFTVVITILQNWHSVHLLLGESKNIQKNRTNYTIMSLSFMFFHF